MTPEERQIVIEALRLGADYADSRDTTVIDAALVIVQEKLEPSAWIVHAKYPWVTMDPPIKGGLRRTPLYR